MENCDFPITCHVGFTGGCFFLETCTLPETNIAPENQWLEDEFPFGMACFKGRTVSFRECTLFGTKTSTLLNPNESPRDVFPTDPFAPHVTFGGTRLLSGVVGDVGSIHKIGCEKTNQLSTWGIIPVSK